MAQVSYSMAPTGPPARTRSDQRADRRARAQRRSGARFREAVQTGTKECTSAPDPGRRGPAV
eukprot:1834207-Prymnesium_polylepis.1